VLNITTPSENVGFVHVIDMMILTAQTIATYAACILLEEMVLLINIQTLYKQWNVGPGEFM
jgi:hypothetical protein